MKPADIQAIKDAVGRNAAGVVSLPSSAGLRHHRTRFLASEEDGFWVEAPRGEQAVTDDLRLRKQLVGFAFKAGYEKVIFTTVIREHEPALPLAADATVAALLLAWPDQVQSIQRRSDYRVGVPADGDVKVRIWRIADHAHLRDKPLPSTLLKADVRDLSVGGMGLLFTADPKETAPPPELANQRIRVSVTHPDGELVLEGRVKHVRPLPNDTFRLGVQFKKLDDDIDGRQSLATLTQVIGQLQRAEIRKRRIALSRKTA